jgi:hypothetical protein
MHTAGPVPDAPAAGDKEAAKRLAALEAERAAQDE